MDSENVLTNGLHDIAKLDVGDQSIDLHTVIGTENECAIDTTKLRAQTGYIALDPGFGNTGSCTSEITYIDGEKGILRYRGINIEELAEKGSFIETALLLIYGELPKSNQLGRFRDLLKQHELLHEGLHNHFDGFPTSSPPMAILSAMINAVSCYHPDIMEMEDEATFESAAARLMSKVRTIAAAAYKTSIGHPVIYPRPELHYCDNLLHMMFSLPYDNYELDPDITEALERILILHADHEQNCSTSTVRMVASSGANLFASCAAGVCALWGPLHGGANAAVIKMLERIHKEKIEIRSFMEQVKTVKSIRLMGFGHRVYKNFDPRATILKQSADKVLSKIDTNDPLLDLARRIEEVALKDNYFIDRKLYPNVDFYSGIIMRALGVPVDMFTVLFAIGRMPGWIAQWKEQHDSDDGKIFRPRQIYTGHMKRPYVPIDQRQLI